MTRSCAAPVSNADDYVQTSRLVAGRTNFMWIRLSGIAIAARMQNMVAVPQPVFHKNHSADEYELTILMPCLNEAETIADCIGKAQGFLADSGIAGEVLIADNGSTDASRAIAARLGARVVRVEQKGYGSALLGGIR